MSKRAQNTTLAFGDYEITVRFQRAEQSREPKLEHVNEQGGKVTVSGGGVGGSRRPAEGVSKAVRVSEEHVVRIPQEELDEIAETSKEEHEQMRVIDVIDYRQVDTARVKGGHWLEPDAGSAKALRMLHDALREDGKVAVVEYLTTSREKLGIIRPRRGTSLLLSELAFADDFRGPDEDQRLEDIEVDPRSVEAAKALLEAFRSEDGHAIDRASDGAVNARIALVERKVEEDQEGALERAVEDLEPAEAPAR